MSNPFLPPSTLILMTTLPSPSPSPLPPSHPIHPIFHPRSFPSLPPLLYAHLTPSLHLASQLLLSPASLTWYLPVLLASPLPIPRSSPRLTSRTTSYLPAIAATRANLNRVRKRLERFAGNVTFAFRDEGAWGAFASCHPHGRWARVYLDSAYRTHLQRPEAAGVGEEQRMLWHLHVATLLLHELAHAVWMVRFPPLSHLPCPESLHSLAPQEVSAELGASFESALFGGKMQPTNLDSACGEGLVWYVWPGEEEAVREFWGVGMEWVEGVWRGEWRVGEGVGVVGEMARVPFSERWWRGRGRGE